MDITSPKWISKYMQHAELWASSSKDPHTHVGAIIIDDEGGVVASGFNGIPRGVDDLPERMTRDGGEKYLWMAHAEENAISNAAMLGHATKGTTMFVTHQPCARCAGMIVNAGIKCVVIDNNDTTISEREKAVANTKFTEAYVKVTRISSDRLFKAFHSDL